MENTTKSLELTYFEIRQVANGWLVDAGSHRGDYAYMADISRIFVFRTLDEMFAWIRANTITTLRENN